MKYTNIPLNCSKQNSDVTSKGMKCNKILTKKSTSRLVFVLNNKHPPQCPNKPKKITSYRQIQYFKKR